jgi:peptide-methionine (S)-S-oxide reductase
MFKKKLEMPSAAEALPGRSSPIRPRGSISSCTDRSRGRIRTVFRPQCSASAASGVPNASFGAGRRIYTTAVGYAGGHTPNPTYEEVCSGRTGHNEVVLVVYDPKRFPTSACSRRSGRATTHARMRQGNDVGTQYRSGIYAFTPEQRKAAEASKAVYDKELKTRRFDAISTEIVDAPAFYLAEDYHQQYLAKNPMGYCGLGGTGVSCPIGIPAEPKQAPSMSPAQTS